MTVGTGQSMLDTAIIVMSWVVRVTGYTCVLVMNGRTALLFISYSADDSFYLFFRTHPRDISQFAFIQVYLLHTTVVLLHTSKTKESFGVLLHRPACTLFVMRPIWVTAIVMMHVPYYASVENNVAVWNCAWTKTTGLEVVSYGAVIKERDFQWSNSQSIVLIVM